jgi:hypothetical protein
MVEDKINKTLADLFTPNPEILNVPPPGGNTKTGELSKISLLFLDVDGVLNGTYSQIVHGTLPHPDSGSPHKGFVYGEEAIDKVAASLINMVCKATGSLIVISSAWRIGFTMEDLRTMMGTLGIDTSLIIGRTDTLHYEEKNRGNQIERFLKDVVTPEGRELMYKHNRLGEWVKFEEKVDVTTYAIVDDDNDMLESQIDNFVQTTFLDGLKLSHVLRLGQILANDDEFYINRLAGAPVRPLW